MKRFALAVIAALTLHPALADDTHHRAGAVADGEVRKVDKDAQKITVRHGPLPQLDMPMAMTMVYRVQDPGMLDKVKQGDRVKFRAEKIGGAFTLTMIEPAR